MAKLNHNRPYLKYIDNIIHEIAEIDSWYKPATKATKSTYDIGICKKKTTITPCGDSRKRSIREIDKKVHLLACSIIAHIEKHRTTGVNADLANSLVNSLPAGVRKNALRDWFCAFGAVSYNDETKKLRYDKEQSTRQLAAEAKPFWEFKPEADYKAFDFNKALADLLKRTQKHLDEKNALDVLPTPEILQALKALAPAA